MLRQDTIAAIATPFGTAGIGIIRLSGPQAYEIAQRIFKPAKKKCSWKSHVLYHGDIVSADGKTILDEVLISCMRNPHSFTGEDIIEINCHGSPLIMQTILEQLVNLGCRLADAGEFTQRAFYNNRLDLSQAEALAAMVVAKSSQAYAIGLAQLKGELSQEIENLRLLLIDALALLEANIDFTEDISAEESSKYPPQIDIAAERVQLLLSSYSVAKSYTEGVNVVITGRPNVGKSSLLNKLAGRKKAIVTDIPGTTRDLITDTINIHGIPFNLVDTAGIRKPRNAIEKEGINLVWERLANADLVIIMLDGSKPLTDEDRNIINKNINANIIVTVNKIDLPVLWKMKKIECLVKPETRIIKISAKFGTGLEELKDAVVHLSGCNLDKDTSVVMITNLRHKQALEKTKKNIQAANDGIAEGMSPEFVAFELREALDNLDEITGKKINDDILNKIFSSFCIGK
ncbi:MAG: tRNA uridine-5-carboxymethylaminomethyl(34) synthesis GTPase MnmE [Deltaproteobacteria bacterium RBG_19FT_COMBO_43_11]|nr:MAG: tRNA uridine-5-carboxymethylaminomethyl(34) synthesis GTPase MnmE [Deltaproteobacteria bacterium RBG_19FT_COMBO_43_11]